MLSWWWATLVGVTKEEQEEQEQEQEQELEKDNPYQAVLDFVIT